MKTIKVKGSTKIKQNIVSYRAKIILYRDQGEFGGQELETVEDLKHQYYQALVEYDVNIKNFEENEFEYFSQNYSNPGTMLIYTCKSFKEMQNLLNVKLPSIYSTALEVKVSDVEQYETLLTEAISDARKRADLIAKKMSKIIIGTQCVKDYNNLNTFWTYYNPYEEFFDLEVTFEVE